MLYIVILLYLIILVLKYDLTNAKTGKSFHYYLLEIIFILLAGCSYRLGIDCTRYEIMYENIPAINESGVSLNNLFLNVANLEPLWVLLNSICKVFSKDFFLVKLIVAIFVNTTIFWFCRKHSDVPYICITLYYVCQFWNFNFEILRESISVSFFLLALHNIIDGRNNIIKYYLIIIPAIFFHSFGFIALFFPLLKRLDVYKNYKTIVVITIVLTPLLMAIASYLFQFEIFGDNAARKMEEKYLAGNNSYGAGVFNLWGIMQNVVTICILCYLLMKSRFAVKSELYTYALIYSLVLILVMGFAILYRLNNYFSIPLYICLAQFISVSVKKYVINRSFKIIMFILFVMLTIQPKLSESVYRRYTPYSSIFTKQIDLRRENIYMNINNR